MLTNGCAQVGATLTSRCELNSLAIPSFCTISSQSRHSRRGVLLLTNQELGGLFPQGDLACKLQRKWSSSSLTNSSALYCLMMFQISAGTFGKPHAEVATARFPLRRRARIMSMAR